MDYQKENNGLEVNSSLFTSSDATAVSFQDFFDDNSIDSLDQFVFNNNNISHNNNNTNNGFNSDYQLVANTNSNTAVSCGENRLSTKSNRSDEDMNDSMGCNVPFEYVIHEQQNDRYFKTNAIVSCLVSNVF